MITKGDEVVDTIFFTIRIRLKHPSMSTANITEAMGCDAEHKWDVGDLKKSPDGKSLPGRRSESYWTLSKKVFGKRLFFKELDYFLDNISSKNDFIKILTESGGTACIDIGLQGNNNIGDVISRDKIIKLYDSGFDLGIEVFPPPPYSPQ